MFFSFSSVRLSSSPPSLYLIASFMTLHCALCLISQSLSSDLLCWLGSFISVTLRKAWLTLQMPPLHHWSDPLANKSIHYFIENMFNKRNMNGRSVNSISISVNWDFFSKMCNRSFCPSALGNLYIYHCIYNITTTTTTATLTICYIIRNK